MNSRTFHSWNTLYFATMQRLNRPVIVNQCFAGIVQFNILSEFGHLSSWNTDGLLKCSKKLNFSILFIKWQQLILKFGTTNFFVDSFYQLEDFDWDQNRQNMQTVYFTNKLGTIKVLRKHIFSILYPPPTHLVRRKQTYAFAMTQSENYVRN